MKKIFFAIVLLLSAVLSAQIDVSGPTDGTLLSPLPSAVLNGLSSPREGLLVGNSTTKTLWYFNGTEFVDLMESNQLTETQVDDFVANNGYLTTEVDGSTTNELQDLTFSGTTLGLSNSATSFDLSGILSTPTLSQVLSEGNSAAGSSISNVETLGVTSVFLGSSDGTQGGIFFYYPNTSINPFSNGNLGNGRTFFNGNNFGWMSPGLQNEGYQFTGTPTEVVDIVLPTSGTVDLSNLVAGGTDNSLSEVDQTLIESRVIDLGGNSLDIDDDGTGLFSLSPTSLSLGVVPTVPNSSTPSTDNHLTPKGYVDNAITASNQTAIEVPYTNNSQPTVESGLDDLYTRTPKLNEVNDFNTFNNFEGGLSIGKNGVTTGGTAGTGQLTFFPYDKQSNSLTNLHSLTATSTGQLRYFKSNGYSGNATNGISFDFTNSALRIVNFPDKNGTVAYLDDINGGGSGLSGENVYMDLTSGDIDASNNNFINSLDISARNNNIVNGATSVTFGSGITTTRIAIFEGEETTVDYELIPDTNYKFRGTAYDENKERAFLHDNEKLKCTNFDDTIINKKTVGGDIYYVKSTCEIVANTLPHPNDNSANAELIDGMAFSFPPDEANNVASTSNVVISLNGTATISSVANTDNGYGKSYVGSTTSNATGGADRIGITFDVPTTGTVKILLDYRMTVGTEGRYRLISGGTGFTNRTDLDNTTWQGDILEDVVTVDGSGTIFLQIYGEGNTGGNVGDTMEFIISAEAQ